MKNAGPIGSKASIKIYQNTAPTHSASLAEIYNVTMNLLNTNTFKTVYIPINNVIVRKESGPGTGSFAPYQILSGGQIYPGGLMIGLSLVAPTITGSVSVVIDDIELVNSIGAVDDNWDGIADSLELPLGISANNILDDSDGDGISNYVELVQGTNSGVANRFPLIDGFEGNGYSWVTADNVTYTIASTTNVSATVTSNGSSSLLITGVATANYYAGFASAWVKDASMDFNPSYQSIKFVLRNEATIGDKIKIQLNEHDGDVWDFTQVINDVNNWHYFTLVLASFNLAVKGGDGVMNFSPTAGVGGLNLFGIAVISHTQTGNVRFYIDSIEASTVPTSDDTDGDGLPNDWEITNGLDPNIASGNNGATGMPAGDGITNLDKYVNGLSPTVSYLFPLIDSFSTANGWATADSLTLEYTGIANLTGTAQGNYYVGYLSKYVGNYLFDWSKYGFVQVSIQNWGQAGDKIQLQLVDNDTPTAAVLLSGADRYVFNITLGASGSSEIGRAHV